MPRISYNLITKDCPESLERCLTSVYESLYEEGDECVVVDTGSTEENLKATRAVVEGFRDARLLEHPELTVDMRPLAEKWLPKWADLCGDKTMKSFAAAREIARKDSKNPVLFWIDCDDILEDQTNGGLRSLINEGMDPASPKVSAVFLDYNYAHDKDGQCTTVLKRERFVLREDFYWKGRCHEVLIPREDAPVRPNGYFQGLPARIVHQKGAEDETEARRSDVRNYLIQRQELEEDGDLVDTRTRFYFANANRGLRLFWDAIRLYKEFAPLSGSQDDRWASWYYIGNMYLQPEMGRPFDAVDAHLEAIKINPHDPRGYFGVARAYADLQRWDVSLQWYKQGLELPAPSGLHSMDPTQVHYHPHLLAARAYTELKQYDKALECAQIAAAWRQQSTGAPPSDEDLAVRMVKECNNALAAGDICKGLATICNSAENPGGPNTLRIGRRVCEELVGVPADLEDHGIGKVEPPDPRPAAPSLAIWTGHTGEKWGPRSGKTGIGGSEKMVIMLAREIQARGVNVTVYANMNHKDRGVDCETGVLWRHWAEFDEKRPRDALVIWRAVEALARVQCPAKVRMLWNHDVQNPARYTDEIMAIVDIVQCQSEFHTKPFRDAGRDDILEKTWVARNAIASVHPKAAELDFSEKDPKLVCYTSSPDRGLLTAAKIVREARKTDPDIKFVCCYGITPWARKAQAQKQHYHIPDVNRDCSVEVYERELHAVLDEIDAVVLGRVGWDKVNEIYQRAGVWLYPTRFDEISCMAAMEAQAHGCIPVTSRHGALAETLKDCSWDFRINANHLFTATESLLTACSMAVESNHRTITAKNAQEKFAVGPLADEWIKRLGLEVTGGGASGRAASLEESDEKHSAKPTAQ